MFHGFINVEYPHDSSQRLAQMTAKMHSLASNTRQSPGWDETPVVDGEYCSSTAWFEGKCVGFYPTEMVLNGKLMDMNNGK